MPIPEKQLETWTHQGATVTAESTHCAIRDALSAFNGWGLGRRPLYDDYLQGSYRNATNIRRDSDVDLVVQLNGAFRSDTTRLSEQERAAYAHAFPADAQYSFREFRGDVHRALVSRFGSAAVRPAAKCIKVTAGSGRLAADVVVCIQYRLYRSFDVWRIDDYVEGMTFWLDADQRWIVNYPKVHYANGARKNAADRTNGRYKRSVRMLKNARTYLVERGLLPDGVAPSYFVECLLYNAPDSAFQAGLADTYVALLRSLIRPGLGNLMCQNEIAPLFGPLGEEWDLDRALTFLQALLSLWENWG